MPRGCCSVGGAGSPGWASAPWSSWCCIWSAWWHCSRSRRRSESTQGTGHSLGSVLIGDRRVAVGAAVKTSALTLLAVHAAVGRPRCGMTDADLDAVLLRHGRTGPAGTRLAVYEAGGGVSI